MDACLSRRGWRTEEGWPRDEVSVRKQEAGEDHSKEHTTSLDQFSLKLRQGVRRLSISALPGTGNPDEVHHIVNDNTRHKASLGILILEVELQVRSSLHLREREVGAHKNGPQIRLAEEMVSVVDGLASVPVDKSANDAVKIRDLFAPSSDRALREMYERAPVGVARHHGTAVDTPEPAVETVLHTTAVAVSVVAKGSARPGRGSLCEHGRLELGGVRTVSRLSLVAPARRRPGES